MFRKTREKLKSKQQYKMVAMLSISIFLTFIFFNLNFVSSLPDDAKTSILFNYNKNLTIINNITVGNNTNTVCAGGYVIQNLSNGTAQCLPIGTGTFSDVNISYYNKSGNFSYIQTFKNLTLEFSGINGTNNPQRIFIDSQYKPNIQWNGTNIIIYGNYTYPGNVGRTIFFWDNLVISGVATTFRLNGLNNARNEMRRSGEGLTAGYFMYTLLGGVDVQTAAFRVLTGGNNTDFACNSAFCRATFGTSNQGVLTFSTGGSGTTDFQGNNAHSIRIDPDSRAPFTNILLVGNATMNGTNVLWINTTMPRVNNTGNIGHENYRFRYGWINNLTSQNIQLPQNGKILFNTQAEIYTDGINLIFNTNKTTESNLTHGLAYFSGNISSAGYITRTEVYDKNKGKATDLIKDADYYRTSTGKVNHSAFGYSSTKYKYNVIIREEKFNKTTESCWENFITDGFVNDTFDNRTSKYVRECKNSTEEISIPIWQEVEEEAVDLTKEIALLKQAIYELIQENKALKADIENIKAVKP